MIKYVFRTPINQSNIHQCVYYCSLAYLTSPFLSQLVFKDEEWRLWFGWELIIFFLHKYYVYAANKGLGVSKPVQWKAVFEGYSI